jgi:cobalt-zinc-cadmium efflux system outer membrane protein
MQKLFLRLGLAALACMPALSQAQPTSAMTASPVAQSTGPLTLTAALDLALAANPELAAAAREVDASDGAVRQAGIIPNPDLAAVVEDRDKATRTTTVQLNQPIELGGKRSSRVTAAERGRDAAQAELAAKRAGIRAMVVSSFYEVLSAQERLRLARASVELAQRATTTASKRVMAGKVSPVEETKARVAESGVRIELSQAVSELANARRRLSATWGSNQPVFERADGQVDAIPPAASLPDLIRRLEQSPSIARARIEVERRHALVQVERSRQYPNVTVSVGAKREEQLGRSQAILGLSVPLPLFDRNQGNVQEALSRTDKARDELAATEVRLGNELAQWHERLMTARTEADLLQREVLPGAQSAYDAAVKGFEFGKFGFLDVLDAQRTLFQARSQFLRTLSEAHRASAEIERLVGPTAPIARAPAK